MVTKRICYHEQRLIFYTQAFISVLTVQILSFIRLMT